MTSKEAIQYNKNLREYMKINDKKSEYKFLEENYIALDMANKALEIVNDFESAQIITGGRLNGRTYAYKCGLADGQRLAKGEKIFNILPLEQQPRDCETCKHSDNGNCAGTEECHECMWENKYDPQPCEDRIRELIREFDNKHPALFADYMREFNNHPISEIIEYMWDMHDLIEDIEYRLPNEGGEEE